MKLKKTKCSRKKLWQRWSEMGRETSGKIQESFPAFYMHETTVSRHLEEFVATWPIAVITLDFTFYQCRMLYS